LRTPSRAVGGQFAHYTASQFLVKETGYEDPDTFDPNVFLHTLGTAVGAVSAHYKLSPSVLTSGDMLLTKFDEVAPQYGYPCGVFSTNFVQLGFPGLNADAALRAQIICQVATGTEPTFGIFCGDDLSVNESYEFVRPKFIIGYDMGRRKMCMLWPVDPSRLDYGDDAVKLFDSQALSSVDWDNYSGSQIPNYDNTQVTGYEIVLTVSKGQNDMYAIRYMLVISGQPVEQLGAKLKVQLPTDAFAKCRLFLAVPGSSTGLNVWIQSMSLQ